MNLANRIELFIFTYNRASCLEHTLQQLSNSPFAGCRITILDNASSDATPKVGKRFARKFKQLRIIRHRENIGCSANYLRAVELSERFYTWVLCDDDTFDFSKFDDIVEKIVAGEVDLISLGVEGHRLKPGTLTSTRDCALSQEFCLSHSFIPSLIFKTEHFDSDNLVAGYHNADTLMPHFPFVTNMAQKDAVVYVSKDRVIQKGNNFGYAPFHFLIGWLRGCNKIPDAAIRRKAYSEVFGGKSFFMRLTFTLLIETTHRSGQMRNEFKALTAEARTHTPLLLLKLYLFLPLVLAPEIVHRWCWNQYVAYRRRLGQDPPNFDAER